MASTDRVLTQVAVRLRLNQCFRERDGVLLYRAFRGLDYGFRFVDVGLVRFRQGESARWEMWKKLFALTSAWSGHRESLRIREEVVFSLTALIL